MIPSKNVGSFASPKKGMNTVQYEMSMQWFFVKCALERSILTFRKPSNFASHASPTWKSSLGEQKGKNAGFMFFSWQTKKHDNCGVLDRPEADIKYCKSVRHTQTVQDFTP